MDEQTGEKTLKTCWLIICFSVGSHRGQKQPRNAFFCTGATNLPADGPTDGQTSYREEFLTDATKNLIRFPVITTLKFLKAAPEFHF